MSDKVDILRPLRAYRASLKDEAKAHQDPVIPFCDDCELPANPAWRLLDKAFCRVCAAPELKHPSHYLSKEPL